MTLARYKVPYQVVIRGRDLGSGKAVSNILYFRTGTVVTPPLAYHEQIPGSDLEAFLGDVQTAWQTNFCGFLNHNYTVLEYVLQAIKGKQYNTPMNNIIAMTKVIAGGQTTFTVTTADPHGFVVGEAVYVSGMLSWFAAQGVMTVESVTSTSFTYTVDSVVLGSWGGDGFVQAIGDQFSPIFEDKVTITAGGSDVGAIAGDALPLFCSASVRKLNTGAGRHFRGRLSMSPMSESDSVDGGFTSGRITAINALLATWVAINFRNGSGDGSGATGAGAMRQMMLSQVLMYQQASPFTSSDAFMMPITSMTIQRNCGSITRRKPKLTAIIT